LIVQWFNSTFYLFGAFIYLLRNRNTIDIIHTHIAGWNAGFAGWIGNLLGIPVLCKAAYLPAFHEFNRSVPFSETWRSWRRRISYIALTQEMAEDIVINGVPRERIHVIPNGVTISHDITPVDTNAPALYVGNFSQGPAHKGFDVLINAWDIVHRVLPEARLVIAGGGDSKPWQALATTLKCGESIRFAGHVSEMDSCYRQAALLVLPSREEGISNALLEAQSFGIPAVASDIPGNREIIVHGQTGLLVPVDDVEAFADAILKLIQDAGLRRHMGQAAKERIIEKFSIASVVDRICEVYSPMIRR
jgi:glycosyltransferase involved in cell wall biosynthesis